MSDPGKGVARDPVRDPFGEVLPEGDRGDDPREWGDPVGRDDSLRDDWLRDDWLRDEVPPHHG